MAKIDKVELSIEEILQRVKISKENWEELKIKGREFHEKDLLDFHDFEVENNILAKKLIQNKIINSIKKSQ